jgi:hypothetical protein
MEDYTYHFDPGGMKVLGAHMLEICPTIAAGKPSLEIHPLSIGGKDDPCRLVFDAPAGPALNASILDMGNRFRMIVNEVDVVPPDQPLPKLPVARALWAPRPDLKVAAAAWILAGGPHHTSFSHELQPEPMQEGKGKHEDDHHHGASSSFPYGLHRVPASGAAAGPAVSMASMMALPSGPPVTNHLPLPRDTGAPKSVAVRNSDV